MKKWLQYVLQRDKRSMSSAAGAVRDEERQTLVPDKHAYSIRFLR